MYPNAKQGLNKIFLAMILSLCNILVAGIGGGLLGAGAVSAVFGGGGALIAVGIVFTVAAVVISIICLVFQLMGLNMASQDNKTYVSAITWVIVSIAGSVAGSLLGLIPVVGWLFSMLGSIAAALGSYFSVKYILQATIELLKSPEFDAKAKTVNALLVTTMILSIVSAVLSPIPVIKFLGGLASLGNLVVSIIYYVLYMSFIAKAKDAM